MDKDTFSLKIGDTYDLNNRLIANQTNKRDFARSDIKQFFYTIIVSITYLIAFQLWWGTWFYHGKRQLSYNIEIMTDTFVYSIPFITIVLYFFFNSKGKNLRGYVNINEKSIDITIQKDYYQRIIIEDLFIKLLNKYKTDEERKKLFNRIRQEYYGLYYSCITVFQKIENTPPNLKKMVPKTPDTNFQYSSHFKSLLGIFFVCFGFAGLALSTCGFFVFSIYLPIFAITSAVFFYMFKKYYTYKYSQITLYQLNENKIITNLIDIKYPIDEDGIDFLNYLLEDN